MKKIFGYKSITHLIYGIIVLMPFLTIFGRCVYTIVNKNAYESYYGKTINEKYVNNVLSLSDLSTNTYYKIQNENYYEYTQTGTLTFYDINNIVNYGDSNDISETKKIALYSNLYNNVYSMYLVFYRADDSIIRSYNLINYRVNIEFFSNTYSYSSDNVSVFLPSIKKITFNKYSYLDNAFEYSISTFIQDNNNGNVDLFSWFTDLFLDTSNAKNMLYINFVNWYLNYTLFVSCGYLLFLVLLWFVNYSRALLDKGMNKDHGGY